MNVLSWNCQGLGNSCTVRVLGDLIKSHKPDVLFLSETLSKANRIEQLRIKFGFSQCFAVDCNGRSGGLGVFWRHNASCEITGYSQNHVDIHFMHNNTAVWRLSCFYGLPERSRRQHSWNLIRTLASRSDIPWCIIGDFNDLLYDTDKWGNNPHPRHLLEGFRKAIDDSMLAELDLHGGKYTWERWRGKPEWVKERLDRGFATQGGWDKFPISKLSVIHSSTSDHDPIFLDLVNTSFSKKVFRFRFENTWLKEPTFRKDVSEFWTDMPAIHLLPKLISVSSFMARWGRNFFHKFRDKVKTQKEIVSSLSDRVDSVGVEQYFAEKEELNKLLLHEELYWKQRAKNFWLAEGDANTKFFHASATARRKTNHITFLEDENGEHTYDHEAMCRIVKDYFTDIFSAHQAPSATPDLPVESCITAQQNEDLIAELTFEEFSLAVKQMHPDKASGPDGLNPAFFQQFWSLIGHEVFLCCKEWLTSCSLPANINDTNVVLIPKKDNASRMQDLRPIALCNVLYKILSKVLANRLKVILPTIISEHQSAFVPGRSITDNVLVAFEVIHHMQRKKASETGEVALKLDISKAYDRVDWGYLKERMRSMGFNQKWINWVMMCVNTVSYEFCFNGSTVGPILPTRGLRQGDPLSPYLFLLCVEGLSQSLSRAANEGLIHGSQICQSAPTITHLLFADDSFLFFHATRGETEIIKGLLNTYERLSGQSVNFQKSGIHFSSNVKQAVRSELSSILGVTNNLQDSKYLGLPSLIGRSKKRVFSFIKDKVWKRVQGWKSKHISQAGKSVLIKNGAQSIPSYCMSCFLIPKSLCLEIERIMNNYWWNSNPRQNKGINWIGWQGMSISKQKGGLGFRSLYGFNIALIGKQCWKFIKEPQSLVARLYKARYFPDCHLLQATMQRGASFIWAGLMTAKASLRDGYRWVLGDGKDINAVADPWPRRKEGYCVDQDVNYGVSTIPVADFILNNPKRWDEAKVEETFSERDAQLILETTLPQATVKDRLAWPRAMDGQYNVKSGYQHWCDVNLGNTGVMQSKGWSKLWKTDLPHKIQTFMWRFSRNTVPVRNRLRGKGVDLPIICPMCDMDVEHLLHLFFDCPFAQNCWQYVGRTFDMDSVEDAPQWLLQKLKEADPEEVMLIARVLWGIWFFRNRRVWENKVVSAMVAMEWSAKYIADWRKAKESRIVVSRSNSPSSPADAQRWKTPAEGYLKLNTDASIKLGEETFSVGLILRDHKGAFVGGKTQRMQAAMSVFEAEVLAIREGLRWMVSLPHQLVVLETDSLLAVRALTQPHNIALEVGLILDECREIIHANPGFSITFAKRQANKAAHLMARLPCLLDCPSIFMSPPSMLLETLLYDSSI